MNIHFKPATQLHIQEILEMMSLFNAIYDYPFNYEIRSSNLKTFLKDDHLGEIWLIYFDQEIIGYIILAYGFSFEYGGRDAFIDELFIKEKFRGKGVGKSVMKFISNKSKELNIKALHLEVENNNEVGKKLYIKSGFKGNNRCLLTKKLI